MSTPEPLGEGTIPEWTLGDRLRKARQAANVSTEEMAGDVGRTVHTISNYERDVTTAPLSVVKLYAMRCGVPLHWLLYGQTGMPERSSTGEGDSSPYRDGVEQPAPGEAAASREDRRAKLNTSECYPRHRVDLQALWESTCATIHRAA